MTTAVTTTKTATMTSNVYHREDGSSSASGYKYAAPERAFGVLQSDPGMLLRCADPTSTATAPTTTATAAAAAATTTTTPSAAPTTAPASSPWDELMRLCAYFETVLDTTHANSSDYTLFVREAIRKQLTATDPWGNNVLHTVCYHKPPVQVVLQILKTQATYNDTCRRRLAGADPGPIRLHTSRAQDGSTPLHVACACGASVDVLRALLRPRLVLACCRTGISTGTNNGDTKKNGTAVPKDDIDGTSAISLVDTVGRSPITELVNWYNTVYDSSVRTTTTTTMNHPSLERVSNIDQARKQSVLFDNFWQKLVLLLDAAWWNTVVVTATADATRNTDTKSIPPAAKAFSDMLFAATKTRTCTNIPIVHKAANVSYATPQMLQDMLVRCYPEQITQSLATTTTSMIFPLHIALMSLTESKRRRIVPDACHAACMMLACGSMANTILAQQRDRFVRVMLRSNPAVVRVVLLQASSTHNNNNNNSILASSALSLALDTNLPFHDYDASMDGPVRDIMYVARDLCTVRDPVSKAYPFVQAAVAAARVEATATQTASTGPDAPQGKPSQQQQRQPQQVINTIYSLLRLHPQQLQESLQGS